jgi:hypothetical protein
VRVCVCVRVGGEGGLYFFFHLCIYGACITLSFARAGQVSVSPSLEPGVT